MKSRCAESGDGVVQASATCIVFHSALEEINAWFSSTLE